MDFLHSRNQPAMQANDFNKWDQQPRILTDKEIADPLMVINEVFDYAHLPDLRNTLWEWLKTTISGNFNKKSLHYKDRESLMAFYEKMQKLLEATHLLLVAKKLAVRSSKESASQTTSTIKEVVQKIALATDLVPIIERLVTLLSPQLIFEMGTLQETNAPLPVYYFLVVLPNTCTRTYAACQEIAENACWEQGVVQLITLKMNEMQRHLKEGHLLYTTLCTDDYLVYAKDNYSLPQPDNSHLPERIANARSFLDVVLAKAQSFYEGAIFYLSGGNHSLAVFMLQQAAEHALRGFLQAVTGRNNISHELLVLRKQALPFFTELVHILPVGGDKNTCLLHRASKAYVQARYENDFAMPVTEISQLKQWVENLLPQTKRAFEQRMETVLTTGCRSAAAAVEVSN